MPSARAASSLPAIATKARPRRERRNARNAHVALRHRLPLHGDFVDDQPDRQCRHRKVMAAQPQRRVSDDERACERAGDAERGGRQRLPAVIGGEHRGGVAADRRERIVSERDLSGVAHEDVQARHEHHVDRGEVQHCDEIAAGNEHVGDKPRRQRPHRRHHRIAPGLSPDSSERGHRATSRCEDRSRLRCGRPT